MDRIDQWYPCQPRCNRSIMVNLRIMRMYDLNSMPLCVLRNTSCGSRAKTISFAQRAQSNAATVKLFLCNRHHSLVAKADDVDIAPPRLQSKRQIRDNPLRSAGIKSLNHLRTRMFRGPWFPVGLNVEMPFS